MVEPEGSLDAGIVLVVPADARFLHLLRSVTAGVASMLEIPFDKLDDQRIAVAEAANFLLGGASDAATLTLRLTTSPDSLVIGLEADGGIAQDHPDATTGFSWNIIQHLADSAEQTAHQGRQGITMRWATLSQHPA